MVDYSEINIKFKHFDSICRFCLKREMFLKPIFHKDNSEGEFTFDDRNGNESVTEMIEKCIKIEMSLNDSLPKLICSGCLDQLLKCNDFRRQCLKSDEILKKIATNYKNTEIPSELHTRQTKSDLGNLIKMEILIKEEDVNETAYGSYPTESPIIEKSDEKYDSELESNIEDKLSVKPEKGQRSQRLTRPVKLALCNICGKMVQDIPVHLQTHIADKTYKCTQCPKSFARKSRLTAHLIIHSNRRDFKCDICDKAFNEKRSLDIHSVCHTGERKFVCDICNETYKFAQSLRHHKRTHFQDRRHECSTCHRAFYTKAALREHIRTHTGEKPYECEHCGKGFGRSSHLTRHKKTHTKSGSLKCSICKDTFVHKKDLTEHIQNHKTKPETGKIKLKVIK